MRRDSRAGVHSLTSLTELGVNQTFFHIPRFTSRIPFHAFLVDYNRSPPRSCWNHYGPLSQLAMREEQEAQRAAEGVIGSGGNGKPATLKKEEEGRRKRKGRHQQILEEWDDLANEERLCVSSLSLGHTNGTPFYRRAPIVCPIPLSDALVR